MDVVVTVQDWRAGPARLRIDADADASAGQLLDAIEGHLGLVRDSERGWRLGRTGVLVDRAALIGDLQLRSGDEFHRGPPAPRPRPARGPWDLLIVGGAGCGRRFNLIRGAQRLGRSPDCAISLQDPLVSWEHAELVATGSGVDIRDLGSKNGTSMDGVPINGPQPVRPGAVVTVGSTVLAVDAPLTGVATRYTDGRLLFNRQPRVVIAGPPVSIRLPRTPEPPKRRQLPLASSLVPLVLGVAMAYLLHQKTFLLMALLTPCMAVFSLIGDRRSGRSSFRRDLETYEARLVQARAEATEAHAREILDRRRACPDAAQLAARTAAPSADLWERRTKDEDFLQVRLGLADQPSRIAYEGGDPPDERPPGSPPTKSELVQKEFARVPLVPVAVGLREHVLGLTGQESATNALARSIVLQLAALHSPRDLRIACLVPGDQLGEWSWTAWLPHLEGILPGGPCLATTPEAARSILAAVQDIVDGRRNDLESGRRAGTPADHVLVLVASNAGASPPALARLLAEGPKVGVTGIVLAARPEELPGECTTVVTLGKELGDAEIVDTSSGTTTTGVTADSTPVEVVEAAARALAPLRDATARSGSGDLPSQSLLVDLIGTWPPDPGVVALHWQRSQPPALGAIVGVGAAGQFSLDLRRDGPHALVAGTTGAGKSELLQTLVSSLAAQHPPSRLSFVLVDYKGGAAFKDCVDLPHVVGFFTDLDGHLAQRALTSLNAELRRREEILRQAGAKDLEELELRSPETAPASLVIVFDEFAFLKKEVPAFVDGVVDIAQRGRSLGVHLVLATQRPTGVIDDKIRANVTLRISLRVSDETDSTDVIGTAAAARIPQGLAGRALVRIGQGEPAPVQIAYVGARRRPGRREPRVRVQLADLDGEVGSGPPAARTSSVGPAVPGQPSAEHRTDLQHLVAAIQEAAHQHDYPPQPPPWLDALPKVVPIADAMAMAAGPSTPGDLGPVIGVVDEPQHQRQRAWTLDLESGHVLIYGTSGAGKTSLLRMLAAGLCYGLRPADLHLYGLDAASRGLQVLEELPHCGGVVAGDDVERVQRLFAMLDGQVGLRQELFGRKGVGSLTEYRRLASPTQQLPWIVVLLDGLGSFLSTFEGIDHGELVERLSRLATEGGSVGIRLVLAAARRGGIPNALTASVPNRIVLRMADDDEYVWLGVGAAAKGATLVPGRGFLPDGTELQVCVLGTDAAGEAQTQAVSAYARELRKTEPPGQVPPVAVLPEHVSWEQLPALAGDSPDAVALGIDGATMGPAFVRLDNVPTFLVCGPDRTGRSTALLTLAQGLVRARPSVESYLLAPRRTPLLDQPWWSETARGLEACEKLASRLSDRVRSTTDDTGPGILVVMDDGDELTEGLTGSSLERMVRRGRDAGLIALASCQTHVVHRAYSGWLQELSKKAKHGLILSPDIEVDGDLFGTRLPRRSVRAFPPGRGYLVLRGSVALVQVAC